MTALLEKIDKAFESKKDVRLINKMGQYLNGIVTETWVHYSGGKLRGKIRFSSKEKGEIEIDANDILDILLS